jgi:DNA polymerase family A
MSRAVMLDFEFNAIVEPDVNLVCAATLEVKTGVQKNFWLHNSPDNQSKLREYLKQFEIVIGYACVAEARSFLSLGLDPLEFKWLDLYLEYKMLTNHNDNLQWGKQLVDGKVKTVHKPKPKWERTEEDNATGFKATHSLAEATYKLTGQIRDTKHKTAMRDLIISAPEKFSAEERDAIMGYCMDDVVFLPKIWKRLKEEFKSLDPNTPLQDYLREAMERGRYAAHTAIMESIGYPIDVEATRNFSKQIPNILMECQRDINAQFPEIKPFKWNKREGRFSWNQVATRSWIEKNHDVNRWMKTDADKISLALEAFEKFYQFKHDYPVGNFGAQMVRYLKLKQSLYGFSESGGKRKNFWDSVGSDGRVRPYMNIYGAQSSRSQPAASGFMFLKPAWMRSLVTPKPGKFLAGIDYGQQEFFVSALEARDHNMIEAYLSGDPYLHTAKLSGAVPMDGKREDHKPMRDLFKNTTLGISYQMTKFGLAIKLTNDTGREWTEDEAQEQIDLFYEAYPDLKDYQEELMEDYQDGAFIRLPCGWRMWSDNDNLRSVCNVPIQGFGASVMRKAVDLAVLRGCSVLFTLHDAIYIEGDVGKESDIAILYDSMREAFQFYFKGTEFYEVSGNIKLDPFAWSPDFEKDSEFTVRSRYGEINVPCSNLYIDERSVNEYERFKKYFGKPDSDLL